MGTIRGIYSKKELLREELKTEEDVIRCLEKFKYQRFLLFSLVVDVEKNSIYNFGLKSFNDYEFSNYGFLFKTLGEEELYINVGNVIPPFLKSFLEKENLVTLTDSEYSIMLKNKIEINNVLIINSFKDIKRYSCREYFEGRPVGVLSDEGKCLFDSLDETAYDYSRVSKFMAKGYVMGLSENLGVDEAIKYYLSELSKLKSIIGNLGYKYGYLEENDLYRFFVEKFIALTGERVSFPNQILLYFRNNEAFNEELIDVETFFKSSNDVALIKRILTNSTHNRFIKGKLKLTNTLTLNLGLNNFLKVNPKKHYLVEVRYNDLFLSAEEGLINLAERFEKNNKVLLIHSFTNCYFFRVSNQVNPYAFMLEVSELLREPLFRLSHDMKDLRVRRSMYKDFLITRNPNDKVYRVVDDVYRDFKNFLKG